MSMLGNAGSKAAAQDVMDYITRLVEEENLAEFWRAHEAVMKVYEHAKQIKEAADSGWY